MTELESPHGVATEPIAGVVYWSERGRRAGIYRAAYDGVSAPPQALSIPGLAGQPGVLAIDHRVDHQRLFWIEDVEGLKDEYGNNMYGHQIKSCDLDGQNLKVLATWLMRIPAGLALDTAHDKFYWTERIGGRIHRCPMTGCHPGTGDSGSRPEIVQSLFGEQAYANAGSRAPKLGGIAVDSASQTMFWAEEHLHLPEAESGEMLWGGVIRMSQTRPGSDVTTLFRCRGNFWGWASPASVALFVTSNQISQIPPSGTHRKNHSSDGSDVAERLQNAAASDDFRGTGGDGGTQ